MSEIGGSHAVGIIADDFTGAMDTAHGFAARGYDTTVLASLLNEPKSVNVNADILSVNTNSRYVDEQTATATVVNAIDRVPARSVYKKIDSTLRGNFSAEVDAALTASGATFALVAPAFPSAGRTTEDGVHYVKGKPVTETEYGHDEKGPASSAIPELFAGEDRPVVSIPLETIKTDRDQVASAIEDAVTESETAPIIVCDARTDADLKTIAAASADRDALYVGSGGLAEHLTLDGVEMTPPLVPQLTPGAPLGIVGSVSETTLTQLKHVPDDGVVPVDGVRLLDGEINETAVRQAADRLEAGEPVMVTTATERAMVEETLEAGRERGLTDADIRNRVASGLAHIAQRVRERETPSGLFVTGGDIAIAVLESLDATAVSLSGKEVEAGIPVGQFADGDAAGTQVVTKAGGFGSEEAIVNCLNTLTNHNE